MTKTCSIKRMVIPLHERTEQLPTSSRPFLCMLATGSSRSSKRDSRPGRASRAAAAAVGGCRRRLPPGARFRLIEALHRLLPELSLFVSSPRKAEQPRRSGSPRGAGRRCIFQAAQSREQPAFEMSVRLLQYACGGSVRVRRKDGSESGLVLLTTLMRVVLPAPLGPISPWIVPLSTESDAGEGGHRRRRG
jgi:hypothetical protein